MMDRNSGSFQLTLPSDREIVMTRVFNAPPSLVFEAHSKPEHVKRWWGCGSFTMTVCEMDFRPGGAWRYVLRAPDGQEFPFKGEYREILPPKRLVYTFIFDVEVIRDHEAIETLTFEEFDGKTRLTATILHDSKESRDGHLQSGMEPGARETWDRLAELVASLETASV